MGTNLFSELAGYYGRAQQRRILEDEKLAAEERGFEKLAPMRKKKRAEEIGAEYGPEAAQQVLTGEFPGKVPYKAAQEEQKLAEEETRLADTARALGYNLETVTPGRWNAPPTPADEFELHEPEYIEETRTPIKRLPKEGVGLLKETAKAGKPGIPNTPYEGALAQAQQELGEKPGSQPSNRALIRGRAIQQQYEQDIVRTRLQGKALEPPTREQLSQFMHQYTTDPATRKFTNDRALYARIEATRNTPFGDVALIFGVMKMLDPESVVKEGEFRTAKRTGAIPDKVWNAFNLLWSGKTLTDSQRKDMLNTAKQHFAGSVRNQMDTETMHQSMAEGLGMGPEGVPDVIGRYRPRPGQKGQGKIITDYGDGYVLRERQ